MRRWVTVSMPSLLGMNPPKQHPMTRLISGSTGELQTNDSDSLRVGLCRWCCHEAKKLGRAESGHWCCYWVTLRAMLGMTVQCAILDLMRLNCRSVSTYPLLRILNWVDGARGNPATGPWRNSQTGFRIALLPESRGT